MRAVLQRVRRAEVRVGSRPVAEIGPGLLLLVGVAAPDTSDDARALADKLLALRIFPDAAGRMNRAIRDVDGAVLVVSQFTLCADLRRGRRPSFTAAADPAVAEPLIAEVIDHLRTAGVTVRRGEFGAQMDVELVNDGPVTFVVDVGEGKVR